MKISVRGLVFALMVSLAMPCPAESLLRFARPAGAGAVADQHTGASVKFRGAPRPAAAAPQAAAPNGEAKRQPRVAPPAKLDIAETKRIAIAPVRANPQPRSSARITSTAPVRANEPRELPVAARIGATPISASGGPMARLNATSRRSLFEHVLRQKPNEQYGAQDIGVREGTSDADSIEMPRNLLPAVTATDEALPANEIPPRPRQNVPPANTLPSDADASAEDGGDEGSAEPRWLPLEQGEITAPLPRREAPFADAGDAPALQREAHPEDYALAPLPGPPAPVHGRVGWDPIYPGDPWATYGLEATSEAHSGGLLGWLLSLLRVFH